MSNESRQAFLDGIDALLPAIRDRAQEVEQTNMIPKEIMAWLHQANVFRATQPRQWNGLELDFSTFYEGMARIASACGSTGWVAGVIGIHAWHLSLFHPEAQNDVWGRDPDTLASTSYAPMGKAEREGDGFRVSGRWGYSSGVDHCEWVILGAVVPDPGDGKGPEYRTFLIPRRDFVIDQESWNVAGLAGTGSKDVVVNGAFVPEYRTHSTTQIHEKRNPGFAVNGRPYFHLPRYLTFPQVIAAIAIGSSLKASGDLHRRLVESLTENELARTRMYATWADFQARAERGEEIPYVLRAQARYEAAHAIAGSAGAVFRVLEVNGARTMREGERFQRLFRDLLAMRNHVSGTLEPNATVYALARLGAPPVPFNRANQAVL